MAPKVTAQRTKINRNSLLKFEMLKHASMLN